MNKNSVESTGQSAARVVRERDFGLWQRTGQDDTIPATGVAGCGRTLREAAAAAGQPTASSPEASRFFKNKTKIDS